MTQAVKTTPKNHCVIQRVQISIYIYTVQVAIYTTNLNIYIYIYIYIYACMLYNVYITIIIMLLAHIYNRELTFQAMDSNRDVAQG